MPTIYKNKVQYSGSPIGGVETVAGIIQMYGGSTAPDGYLLCDGSAVSRTVYQSLFEAIGTTYGAGDGSTTFNLPDLQGRVPIGAGESDADGHSNHALGDADGKEAYKLTAAQSGMRGHTHNYSDYNTTYSFATGYRTTTDHSHSALISATAGGGATTRTSGDVNTISGADATDYHTNMQPYLTVNYIISIGRMDSAFSTLIYNEQHGYSGGIQDKYLLTPDTQAKIEEWLDE